LKEREQRDGEVKSWEKEKKRWKSFKTELETEVLLQTQGIPLTCFYVSTNSFILAGCEYKTKNGRAGGRAFGIEAKKIVARVCILVMATTHKKIGLPVKVLFRKQLFDDSGRRTVVSKCDTSSVHSC
jgi:hypothetical protein